MQNKLVPQKYRRELKDFIVDYYAMKDKMITLQMDIQGGKIGRGALPMMQAMFAQLPGLATADRQMARRQLETVQGFISGVKENPEKYGNYSKEPDYKFQNKEQTSGGPAAGMVRFQDSHGSVYDIPKENLDRARQRDPGLRVVTQ